MLPDIFSLQGKSLDHKYDLLITWQRKPYEKSVRKIKNVYRPKTYLC